MTPPFVYTFKKNVVTKDLDWFVKQFANKLGNEDYQPISFYKKKDKWIVESGGFTGNWLNLWIPVSRLYIYKEKKGLRIEYKETSWYSIIVIWAISLYSILMIGAGKAHSFLTTPFYVLTSIAFLFVIASAWEFYSFSQDVDQVCKAIMKKERKRMS